MPFVSLPADSPAVVNPERVLAIRPNPMGCEVVVGGGRSIIAAMTPEDAAKRLGPDFKAVQLSVPGGVAPAFLNKSLISDVAMETGPPQAVCFVFVGGVRYPVSGGLNAVLTALA